MNSFSFQSWATSLLLSICVVQCFATVNSESEYIGSPASRIRHVFLIVLENKDFTDTFGTSIQDPYLRETLVPQGALLTQYFGTGHFSLDNYIALLSGQAPTQDTAKDCASDSATDAANYNDVQEIGKTADGQVIARSGCIYPMHVKTLVNQLAVAGFTWKAYMEDMGNNPARESTTCGHPRIGLGSDRTMSAEPPSASVPLGDAYTTRHNPFMYFHSVINSPDCRRGVVNLEHLQGDLSHVDTTPNFSFITPNLCHDGHDGAGTGAPGTRCANGESGGLASADAFLKVWVPRILHSSAYQKDGLLIITFDEGNYAVTERKDASGSQTIVEVTFPGAACCGQQPGPNLGGLWPGMLVPTDTPSRLVRVVVNGYGGDRIGALLLSPFIRRGSTSDTPYNHYALLRSLEEIFGLPDHLGYAADNPKRGYRLNILGTDGRIFSPGGSGN